MNIVSWILQGIVAIAFLMAGSIKVSQSKAFIREKLGPWSDDFSLTTIKLIGTTQILCALGLIFPMWLDIFPLLTPLATIGLMLIMVGAFFTHLKRNEKKEMMTPIIILIVLGIILNSRYSLLF